MQARLTEQQRLLPVELAVFITSRVARGLAYAHAKTDPDGKPLGIVHRDVSFKNILVAFEGDVKLTDFGIAKARGFLADNEGEVVAGKADYMSPEQADFQVTDQRSDLFSVCVVLAHLVLGYNLFKAEYSDGAYQATNFTLFTPAQWIGGKWDVVLNAAPWTELNNTGGHPASGPGEQWAIDPGGQQPPVRRRARVSRMHGGLGGAEQREPDQSFSYHHLFSRTPPRPGVFGPRGRKPVGVGLFPAP